MEDWGIILLYLALIICLILYFWQNHKWTYWSRRGVLNIKPNLTSEVITWFFPRESPIWRQMKGCAKMIPHRYAGSYSFFGSPILNIRDPDLVKAIFVKQTENFSYKSPTFYSKTDRYTHFLVNMSGDEWKWSRVHLSRAFTTEKLKPMLRVMAAAGAALQRSVTESLAENKVIDVKLLAFQSQMDIMAACVFGVDASTIGHEDSVFLEMTRSMFGRNQLSFRYNRFLLNVPPNYRHYFSRTIIDRTSADFFMQQLLDSTMFNEKNNIQRATFVQHFNDIMKLSESNNADGTPKWTIDTSLSHCLLYTFAGIADPSSALSFALYEIAKNTDVQNRLHEEIQRSLVKSKGEISYEVLREMRYLHKVVLETLRKYPPNISVARNCTQTCELADTGVILENGITVSVPIGSIHHDSTLYPDPMNFDPERFNEGWKTSRHPYSYIPFGCGPRMCIAERFVTLALKTVIVSLVSKFESSVLPEDMMPFEADPTKFSNRVTNIKVKFEERGQ